MSIPADHVRWSLFGTGLGEIFETSWWSHISPFPATQDDAQVSNNTIAESFLASALCTRLKGLLFPDQQYTQLRAYWYATTGDKATFITESTFAPAQVGTSGTDHALPLQIAWVATLLTGAAGRSNRGRMYFAAGGAQPSAGHQQSAADTTGLSADLADWFSTISASAPPVVVSRTLSTSRPILDVRVDSILDVQRRRAGKQVATSSVTTPVG